MAFSEEVKLEVKTKAAFRCCRCQQVGVEVHHIIPLKDGGTDDIDNAAPLCPNCHAYFGDNPQKRKEIRQMRDWWYEKAKKMFTLNADLESRINEAVITIQEGVGEQLDDLKVELKEYMGQYIDSLTPSTSASLATSLLDIVSERVTFPKGGNDTESD